MSEDKALFLDRDGVVNVDKTHLYKIEDCEFVEGIFPLCTYAQSHGYRILIVTNQAGIAKGYYTQAQMHALHRYMTEKFSERGVVIGHFYFCPHHPDFTGPCDCRKPAPGMFLQAQKDYGLDMKRCISVGDKVTDIQAGRNAGIEQCYLLKTRYDYSGYQDRIYFSLDEILTDIKEKIDNA